MSNIDAWLDRMISTASSAGNTKRNAHYADLEKERKNKELLQQMSEVGATQRTGMSVKSASDVANINRSSASETQGMRNTGALAEQALKNTGALGVAGVESKNKTDVANINASQLTADRALVAPRLEAANLKISREEKAGQVAKNIDIESNRQMSKGIIDLMNKSTQATDIIEQNKPGIIGRIFEGMRGLTTSAPSQSASNTAAALEKAGVSQKDILTPEQWTGVNADLNKKKKERRLLNTF